jgi:hypothetical protein
MNLPAIIIPILTAPPWSAHPKTEMQAPIKTVFLRPNLSGNQAIESAPGIAPPVKEETIPPVCEEVGVPI